MSETFEEIVADVDLDDVTAPSEGLVDLTTLRAAISAGSAFRERATQYNRLFSGRLSNLTAAGASGWAVVHTSPDAQHYYIERAPAAPSREPRRDPLRRTSQNVRELFALYATQWREDTMFESSVSRLIMHPAYQRIIGLGLPVVPLIISELRQAPDHWFWALSSIVGIDVADGAASVADAAQLWVDWFDSISSDPE